ncbi:TetR/AcrR family transcriptional regulator [Nonomuraea soli]|uniref:AcrR family transcriptional regulator n=1 Tax=Nonomuraea soli TaxID=1032476 RepID=A0A7W0HUY3_9ACTN|nr:TetR/AcrR family transcriptional regulator [Nonomuraea soli]MBA2896452.1 AcrR family transcriptional regulator [Nonomuraea soli]
MPNRDRKSERHARTKQEIIDAAWEIARSQGLAGLTLRDVAQRVGMRAPSLYSYFASKHAIYDAMFADGFRAFLHEHAALEPADDTLAELTLICRHFLGFCTADTVRFQLMFQRTIPGFEPSPESYAISLEGFDLLRKRLARLGITDQESLDLFTAIGSGLAAQQIANDPGGTRWTRLADQAMAMFLRQIESGRTP